MPPEGTKMALTVLQDHAFERRSCSQMTSCSWPAALMEL